MGKKKKHKLLRRRLQLRHVTHDSTTRISAPEAGAGGGRPPQPGSARAQPKFPFETIKPYKSQLLSIQASAGLRGSHQHFHSENKP